MKEIADELRAGDTRAMRPAADTLEATQELQDHIRAHLHWGPLQGDDKIRFMALALCGEAGELANLIKKDWRGDAGDRREKLIEELADVGNYVFMLAEALNVDLPTAMLTKLKAVEQRPEWRAHLTSAQSGGASS